MKIMKKNIVIFLVIYIIAFIAIFSCTSTATPNRNEVNTVALEKAIRSSAEQLGVNLTEQVVAIVAFGSGSQVLSEYVIDELSRELVNSRAVTVVERRNLDDVRGELELSLSGNVSDESAQSIGRMLGAQSVITGILTDLGNVYRFSIKSISVESGAILSMPAFNVGKRDERIIHLAGQRGAALASIQSVPIQHTPRVMPRDLAEVFGTTGVTATFNAVSAFLKTCNGRDETRREQITQRIILGDWIDLPRLTVQSGTGGGAINTINIDLGGNGKLLRLIVVGIDSFVKTNGNSPAHIVFQFQNIPVTRRMNSWDDNDYRGSEIRQYLTGNFLRGLIAAGVPEGTLYAPTRNIGYSSARVDSLSDWLWLPTMWELFGFTYFTNENWENKANQARLEYYQESFHRIKYNDLGKAMFWWTSSPVDPHQILDELSWQSNFNTVGPIGHSDLGVPSWPDRYPGEFASRNSGIAPAFCVR
jgi:hypothetical protein